MKTLLLLTIGLLTLVQLNAQNTEVVEQPVYGNYNPRTMIKGYNILEDSIVKTFDELVWISEDEAMGVMQIVKFHYYKSGEVFKTRMEILNPPLKPVTNKMEFVKTNKAAVDKYYGSGSEIKVKK